MGDLKEVPIPNLNDKKRIIISSRAFKEISKEGKFEDVLEIDTKTIELPIWADFQGIDHSELKLLEDKFNIHPLTIEDIQSTLGHVHSLSTEDIISTDHREKIEVFEDYTLVVVKEIHYEEGTNHLLVSTISIVVFENLILSFHTGVIEPIEKTLRRLKHRVGAISHEKCLTSSDWAPYAVLDAIIDEFMDYVNSYVQESEALDELVMVMNSSSADEFLHRIGFARKQMLFLRSQLWSKREIIDTLVHKPNKIFKESIKLYLRDVLDHILSMNERLTIAQESLANVNNMYLSQVSVEVSEGSNDMTKVMFNFGVVATIFLPLNLIAGLFGMNVRVPGETVEGLVWFFAILGFVALIVGIIVFLFKCVKWM